MSDSDALASRFELHRAHLKSVAYRLLGSDGDADDAVQEAWLRLSRAGADDVDNLRGWLTTVVSRVCLDMLRSRRSRREEPLGAGTGQAAAADPEAEAVLADSVGVALQVVLEGLAPAERVAFVLHDMFGIPFEDIGRIVDRSPAAARQLASRARRRVRGATPEGRVDLARRQRLVEAFLDASRRGDLQGLIALLDPEAVLRSDAAAVAMGSPRELAGAAAVAGTFSGRAQTAEPALIDGEPGLVWAPRGRPRVAFAFTIVGDLVTRIDMLAEADTLASVEPVRAEES